MSVDMVHKPAHYNHGAQDLIESWYRTYPWDQFVAGVEMQIDKYIKRHRYKGNSSQDLDKAIELANRLHAYWKLEQEKSNEG